MPNARRARSTSDDPDPPGNNRGRAVTGDGAPNAYPARPNPALRKELTAAHRADADAIYRRYDIDHGRKGNGQLASADDPKKNEARQAPADHHSRIRDRTIPGDRGDEYDVVPLTRALVREYDLPAGYKSAPALKGDPYHPDSVAARSTANHELYAATSRDRAATLGYTTRISAQKAPFDSHGQEVFTNGKTYITPDVDGHNVTNGWKMFNRRGARIGTYNSELNYVKE